jgi:molybdenum cofactor cytidylyltransferase
MESIGALILAAGGSTRLGQPKQLLIHQGETLVRRAARAAMDAGCFPTVVVTGGQHAQIAEELTSLEVRLQHHPDWRLGIGSSIRAGLGEIRSHQPDLDAVLIMVCDQPFVSAELLASLIATCASAGTRAAACAYAGSIGVPAIFDRTLFPALAALSDDQGAKAILTSQTIEVARLEFPAGAIDIDTPADSRAHLNSTPMPPASASTMRFR